MLPIYAFGISLVIFLGVAKKKHSWLYRLSINSTAFIAIYIATSLFGPTKYSIDTNAPAIKVDGKEYAMAWGINRYLPFESFATVYLVIPNGDLTTNKFVYLRDDVLRKKIKEEARYKRINNIPTTGISYSPYQAEQPLVQYMGLYLIAAWLFFYRRSRKKLAVSLKVETINTQNGNPRTKGAARSEELDINPKRLSVRDIEYEKSLSVVDEWIEVTENLWFGRVLYKRKRLPKLKARRERILTEIITTVGVLAKSRIQKRDASCQRLKACQVPVDEPETFEFLLDWIYQLMEKGHFDLNVVVKFTSSGSAYDLKELHQQCVANISKRRGVKDGKEYQVLYEGFESDTSLRGREYIQRSVIKQLQQFIDCHLPEPIFKFDETSKNTLTIFMADDDRYYMKDKQLQSYFFGTYTEENHSGRLFSFNPWKMKAILIANNLHLSTNDYASLNVNTGQRLSQKLMNQEGKYSYDFAKMDGELPKILRSVVNDLIASAIAVRMTVGEASKNQDVSVKSVDQASEKMDTIFDQIRDEIKDSLIDDMVNVNVEESVTEFLNSDHPIAEEIVTRGIAMGAAIGVTINEEVTIEIASYIAAESVSFIAGSATDALVSGVTA